MPTMGVDARPQAQPERATSAGRGTLAIMLVAGFIVSLDFFIVNVAIPSMQQELRAGTTAVQWVVAGFGLALGAPLITTSRLGDLYGRRRIFLIGIAVFTLASLACGLAPGSGELVAARVAQGIGAALVTPQVIAVLRSSFTGRAQARAFSMYSLSIGVGAVFGQLIGGLLIKADLFGLDWRTCFLVNVPVGVAVLAVTRSRVPESRAPGRTRLDLAGTTLVTGALVCLVLPLIQGRATGWPVWTWLCLAGSAVLLAAFTAHQRLRTRRSRGALVNPAIFAERAFTAGLLAQLVFWLGQASFFLILALYLQQGNGLSPLGSGLVFTAIGAGYMITSTTSHRLAARLGRQVIAVGAIIMTAGLVLLLVGTRQVDPAGSAGAVAWLLPGLFLDGVGMGMVLAPLVTTIVARVAPEHVGTASGLLSTVQQVGNALGVAVIGIVFYGAIGADGTGGTDPFGHAMREGIGCLIAVELTLAVLVQLLPRRRDG